MSQTGHRYALGPDLLVSGGEAAHFVTDLESGDVFELNSTAHGILQEVKTGATVQAMCESLARQYPEVDRAELEADLFDVLDDLVRRGILADAGD